MDKEGWVVSSGNEPTSVRVRIFGEDHVIKGNASDEYIRHLAEIVDTRLWAVQKNNPILPRHCVAILVAINLANELEDLRAEYDELLELLEDAN